MIFNTIFGCVRIIIPLKRTLLCQKCMTYNNVDNIDAREKQRRLFGNLKRNRLGWLPVGTVATTIEITTTIEIIISIVVENAYQTKHHIATTIEITTTIEIIISIVVKNKFQT